MATVVFDVAEFQVVIQRAVETAIREMEERRPRDGEGRTLWTKRKTAVEMGVSEKTIDR